MFWLDRRRALGGLPERLPSQIIVVPNAT